MKKIKLPEVCYIKTGKLDANQAVFHGKYPFFTCGEKPLRIDRYAFDDDAIILAGNNAQGRFHIQRFTGKFNAYQRTYVITAKSGWDVDYIKYAIELALQHLQKIAQGSQTKFLTLSMLEDFQVGNTDYSQQISLFSSVRNLDRKIAINQQINDNLEQQLRTIYDYWFTQFDFPDENGKPYRSSGGKMVWNEELKREIPEGWSVASIISNPLSTVIKPGVTRFDKKTYFATADVDGRNILDGTLIAFEGRESRANMQPTINSIWFAKMKNSIKHLILNAEMKDLIDNSVLSTGFFGLQVQEDAFEYIASFIRSGYFENRKDILAHGATQQAVNNDDLEFLYLVIPDVKTLRAFHDVTQKIYAQISINIVENRKLRKLRDWLLPMLMNGQIKIEG